MAEGFNTNRFTKILDIEKDEFWDLYDEIYNYKDRSEEPSGKLIKSYNSLKENEQDIFLNKIKERINTKESELCPIAVDCYDNKFIQRSLCDMCDIIYDHFTAKNKLKEA